MKNYTKYILSAALIAMTFTARAQEPAQAQTYTRAQERGRVNYYDRNYNRGQLRGQYRDEAYPRGPVRYGDRIIRDRRINWLPEEGTPRRYTIAIRPFTMANHGLRADFEMELNNPGEWLQFSLAGYYAPKYNPARHNGDISTYNNYSGWTAPLSRGNPFHKLGGIGLGVAYKSMITNNGWYWSTGIHFSYFDVDHREWGYYSYIEDGLEFHRQGNRMINTKYYKTGFNVNIGKHFALSRNLFFDAYIGLGYERTFKGGSKGTSFDNGMFSVGYNGLYVSGGFRIGWMWPNKRPVEIIR